jgi:hypothetical protein
MAVSGPLADIPGDNEHDVFVLKDVIPRGVVGNFCPTHDFVQ